MDANAAVGGGPADAMAADQLSPCTSVPLLERKRPPYVKLRCGVETLKTL